LIKDPLNRKKDAYDILELDPNVPRDRIIQALPKFMRKPENRPIIKEGRIAQGSLLSSQKRIKIDIDYYPIRKIDPNQVELKNISKEISRLAGVPIIRDYNDFLLDRDLKATSNDFNEFHFKKIEMLEINEYDNLNNLELEVIFDK